MSNGAKFDNREMFNRKPQVTLGDGKFQAKDIIDAASYISGNVISGFSHAIEGVVDGAVGIGSQLVGNKDLAKSMYQNNWTDNTRKALNNMGGIAVKDGGGWEKAGQVVDSAMEQVTRMTLAVGLASLTGGGSVASGAAAETSKAISNSATAGKISNAMLGLSAYSGAMGNAIDKTGEVGSKETLYGLGSAGVEMATEKVFDVFGFVGGGSMDKVVKKLTSTSFGKVSTSMVGEGLEEVMSEVANPYLQRMTIDKNANNATLSEVGNAFGMGAVVSGILGGGSIALNSAKSKKIGENIIANKNTMATLEKGLSMDVEYAKKLKAYTSKGNALSANQVGKLACEINAKAMENAITNVKNRYGIKSDEKAKAKYADEIALELTFDYADKKLFGENQQSIDAINQYRADGGSLIDVDTAYTVAKRKGGEVNFIYDKNEASNGMTINGKNVVINLAKQKLSTETAVHEAVHTMPTADVKAMLDVVNGIDDNSTRELINQTHNQYSTVYQSMEKNERELAVNEEIVARFMERVIDNPRQMLKQIQGKETLIEKITTALKGFSKAGNIMTASDKQKVNSVYNMYKTVLTDNSISDDKTVRWSKEPFEKQVDMAIAGTFPINYMVCVREDTPEFLQKYGLKNLPMLTYAEHIKNINTPKSEKKKGSSNYHGLPKEMIYKIPKLLENPILIGRSLSHEKDIVVLVDEVDPDGFPILVAIELNRKKRQGIEYVSTNRIKSFYGKENIKNVMKYMINANGILYIKEGHRLFSNASVQFRRGPNKDDLIISIDDETQNVKAFHYKTSKKTKNNQSNNKTVKYSLDESISLDKLLPVKKSISKNTSKEMVQSILTSISFGDNLAYVKNNGEMYDKLYEIMNTAPAGQERIYSKRFANIMIDSVLMENENFREMIENMKGPMDCIRECYMKKVNLDAIKGKIEYHYGKKKGRGIILAWNNKEAQSIDAVTSDNAETLVKHGIELKSKDEAGMFFEMYDIWQKCKANIARYRDKTLTELVSEEELKDIENQISDTVFEMFSVLGRTDKAFRAKTFKNLKRLLNKLSDKAKIADSMFRSLKMAERMKEYKKRKYYKQSVLADESMQKTVEMASRMFSRGKWNIENIKDFSKTFRKMYTSMKERLPEMCREDVFTMLDRLDNIEGIELNYMELTAVTNLLKHIDHLYKEVDVIRRDGKRVATRECAERLVAEQEDILNSTKGRNRLGLTWRMNFADAKSVFRFIAGYRKNSEIMIAYKALTDGDTKVQVNHMNMMNPIRKFFDDNKDYRKRLEKGNMKITLKMKSGVFKEVDVPVQLAISVYETSKRQQAMKHMENGGFTFRVGNTSYRAVADDATIESIGEKLSSQDKAFIDVIENVFNNQAKDLKIQTDLELYGYTNVLGGFYIPIVSDKMSMAQSFTSQKTFYNEIDSATGNMSMNKDTNEKARNPLHIVPIMELLENHVRQVSLYNGLAIPLADFSKLYNANIESEEHVTLKSYLNEIYSKYSQPKYLDNYIVKLLKDLQGIGDSPDTWHKIAQRLRGAWGTYQLGGNVKVVFTQFAAYPMSFTYLNGKSMIKGMKNQASKSNVFKYCPFIEARGFDQNAAKAQLIDDNKGKLAISKIDTAREFIMQPVTWADMITVRTVFSACCHQLATKDNHAFSEKTMERAGKLAEQIIRETQPVNSALETSGAMRTRNDIFKGLWMFKSDIPKQTARLLDGLGAMQLGKASNDDILYKKGKRTFCKVLTAVTVSQLQFVITGMIAKAILKTTPEKEKDEGVTKRILFGWLSSVSGLLPFADVLLSFLMDGFDANIYMVEQINTTMKASEKLIDLVWDMLMGNNPTDQQIESAFYSFNCAIGSMSGIPTRNLYNLYNKTIKGYSPKKEESTEVNIVKNEQSEEMIPIGTKKASASRYKEISDPNMMREIVDKLLNRYD